jgi:enamine deaminase RidA (YjgF/YER057c/UK114 family)
VSAVNPPGWPRPKGYSSGIVASGRMLFVAGQIGWNERGEFVSTAFLGQAERALRNVLAIVRAAGGEPAHVARLTWYVTDKSAYLACSRELGRIYRALFGDHFPAMTLVQVADLLEDAALVEIEATAVLP